MDTDSPRETTICLGTRLVVLLEPRRQADDVGREFAAEGLLVVYEQRNIPTIEPSSTTTSPVEAFRIEIGTNHGVYHGRIDLAQVKLTNGDKKDLAQYLLQDGKEHPDITIQFQHSGDKDNDTLQLIIKERLETLGLQKFVYTGSLSSTRSDGLTTRKIKPSLLQFCNSLGIAINDSVQKIQGLQQELKGKDQSLEYWKETAQQLDIQIWQKEKDRLVHNFLKLWKERQERAKKQMDDLQAELEVTKAALQAKTNEKRKGRSLKLDDAIANAAEDDLTGRAEPIPLDQVEAFATGQKQTTKSATTILKQEDTVSMSTLLQQADDYAKRKRTRKTAAVTRDTDGSDDSDTDDAVEPMHAKRKPRRAKAESQKPTKTAPAKVPKRNSRKAATKHATTESVGDGNESPLLAMDSEDEALRAHIRAGIQKNSPQQAKPMPEEMTSKSSSNVSNKKALRKRSPNLSLDDDEPTNNVDVGNESPLLSLDSEDEALRAQIRAGIQRKPQQVTTMPQENTKIISSRPWNNARKSSPNLSLDDDDDDDDQPMGNVENGKQSPPVAHDSEDEALRIQIRAGIERRLTLSSSDEE